MNIASQIAAGLSKAHANHIVHRDIKPHNIIITKDNIAKVTDFGIAKAVSNSTINVMGNTVGSVHYFSPEHARGGYTDARSDIYSLGVVLYEMVTGSLPFDADTPVSVALKHIQEEPIEPIELNQELPIGVNDIIMKAMSKDISNRYQTAHEMYSDLEKILKSPNDIPNAVVTIRREGEFPTQKIPIVGLDKKDGNPKKKVNEKEENEMKKGITKKQAVVKLILMLIFIIILFVVAFMLGNYVIGDIFGGTPSIKVPLVEGMEQEEAKKVLESNKLVMEITATVESEKYPSGYIESQSPKDGRELKEGATVQVTVSKGNKSILVPDVTSSTADVAKIEIEQRGLVYKAEYKYSKDIPSGDIIEQTPSVNTEVAAGSIVTVYISKGAQTGLIYVPNVIGETEAKASKKITDSKLLPEVTTVNDPDKQDGIVISQNPNADELLSELSTVVIVVNKLPEEKEDNTPNKAENTGSNNAHEGQRLININLSNKGQREEFDVKVTLESVALGTRVEYEGKHTRNDGTIGVYVTDAPGAYLKLYIDGKLDSEQVLK